MFERLYLLTNHCARDSKLLEYLQTADDNPELLLVSEDPFLPQPDSSRASRFDKQRRGEYVQTPDSRPHCIPFRAHPFNSFQTCLSQVHPSSTGMRYFITKNSKDQRQLSVTIKSRSDTADVLLAAVPASNTTVSSSSSDSSERL